MEREHSAHPLSDDSRDKANRPSEIAATDDNSSESPSACVVGFLPIIAQYMKRLRIKEIIDENTPSQMRVSCGSMVEVMILDTLCGRSPFYRLEDFARRMDLELLLGRAIAPSELRDHNVGRVMDHIHKAGAHRLFMDIAQEAVRVFEIDTRCGHFDTTSMSVFGQYAGSEDKTLTITFGHSKDKRPDLKQFLLEMLCVEKNIPLVGRCADGNASDVKRNHELLTDISRVLARNKIAEDGFIYIADSSLVSEENLAAFFREDGSPRLHFITRLPARYKEEQRAIAEAVEADAWEDLGALAQTVDPSRRRRSARYKVYETRVTLYGRVFRAIVVHSSAHDKRRRKKLQRQIEKELEELKKAIRREHKNVYSCRADAEAVLRRVQKKETELCRIVGDVQERPRYGRGRPRKDGTRRVQAWTYALSLHAERKKEAIERREQASGCFVLLTTLPKKDEHGSSAAPSQNDLDSAPSLCKKAKGAASRRKRPGVSPGSMGRNAREVLVLYKEQNGVERNFSFLKDPMIVDAMLLKKTERIEVLGMILLLCLLIWNLIERQLRRHVEESGETLDGWDRKRTRRPTSFMFSVKFRWIILLRDHGRRRLASPLTEAQREYLHALGFTEDIYINPRAP